MLTNSLYLKKHLTKEDIKEYLKRISTLIRRNKVRRTKEKTMSDYEKINEKTIEIIWRHERDFMKLDKFNKKKRKFFKYKKMNHIRRFCRNKESLSKKKKDILIVFEKSKNKNVLKIKKSQNEKL